MIVCCAVTVTVTWGGQFPATLEAPAGEAGAAPLDAGLTLTPELALFGEAGLDPDGPAA